MNLEETSAPECLGGGCDEISPLIPVFAGGNGVLNNTLVFPFSKDHKAIMKRCD